MLRERVFNFTASLVGNVTVNRTVTQTFSTFVSATWIRERISFHSATEKRSELINQENLLLMILAHLLVVLCFVLGYSHMGSYQSLFCE